MIHDAESAAVFDCIGEVVRECSPATNYASLFERAITIVREIAEEEEVFYPIDLPLAASDVLGRPAEERRLAAAASTLVWAGADLMDDAADGQLDESWGDVRPSVLALVATNLLATLPHLVVARLGDDRSAAAYARALSRTLFVMSDGQASDLDSRRIETEEACLSLIRRKTGAQFALYASTPALFGHAGDETIAGWVRFGMAFGTMTQIYSDILTVVAEGPLGDLAIGKRPLPVLRALAALRGVDHTSFLADLDMAASGDQHAARRAVRAMTKTGALRGSMECVELWRLEAARALPVRMTGLPRDHPIRLLLRTCSIS